MTHYIIKSITGTQGKLLFRGIPFGYFDRSGHIPIWNVLTIVRDAFNCVYSHGYIDFVRLTESNAMYGVWVQYRATDEFYNKAVFFNPISFESTTAMKSIGKSSFVDSTTLSEEGTGKFFALVQSKFVLICNDSEKSVPLPEWFIEKYANPTLLKSNVLLGKMPKMIIPKQVFSHKLRSRHSDIDRNDHVATNEYIRFCIECAIEASNAGFYRQFVSEMWLYPVLEADLSLSRPIKEGTEVKISTWQCECNAGKMYFVIFDEKGKISECILVFSEKRLEPKLYKL